MEINVMDIATVFNKVLIHMSFVFKTNANKVPLKLFLMFKHILKVQLNVSGMFKPHVNKLLLKLSDMFKTQVNTLLLKLSDMFKIM